MENYFNQDTIAWLQQRLGRFTSSEIHKLFVGGKKKGELFGVGATTYIRTKAAELLTMEVKEEIDFRQAEWGKANEYDAVKAFEQKIGIEGNYYGIATPTFFPHGEYAGGSPDWESKNVSDGADVKCPFNTAEHVKNLLLNAVDSFKDERWDYYCQGQMNMYIRGWERFHFVSYDPRMIEPALRLKIITFYPDSEWIKEFNERLSAAIEEVTRIIESIEVVLIEHDPEVNAAVASKG